MKRFLFYISFAFFAFNASALELISFSAQQEYANTVNISWETSLEINSDYFIVEKSYNLNDWFSIGKVESVKNSVETNTYSLLDVGPMKLNYYRLRQVDADGKIKYYGGIQVLLNNSFTEKTDLAVLPNENDGTGTIKFTLNNESPVSLTIYDESEKEVEKIQITYALNKGVYSIQHKPLPAGNYTVHFKSGTEIVPDHLFTIASR